MKDDTDGDGNRVLRWINAKELREHLRSVDQRPTEEFRPVLVYSINDHELNGGIERPRVPIGTHLNQSLALAGYTAGFANYQDIGSDPYSFSFDRDIPLEQLSELCAPRNTNSKFMIRQLDHEGTIAKDQKRIIGVYDDSAGSYDQLLRDKVRVVVIASHELTDGYIVKALEAWYNVPSEHEWPTVIHHGGEGGKVVPPERIMAARERYKAEARFLYNHAKTFAGLARRALFKIYFDERLSKQEANESFPSINDINWQWAGPFSLQILHLLKRLGRIGTEQHRIHLSERVDLFSYAKVYAKGLPVFVNVGDECHLVWSGTGRYPEWTLSLGKVRDITDQDLDADSSPLPNRLFQTFQHIDKTGLLGLDGDTIVLSPWGVKFLEIMGLETEDPDVLLRWRTETGEIGGQKDIEEMDLWLERAFGSAARRISKFKEQMALFDDKAYLKKAPRSNQLSLFGVHIPIAEKDLESQEFSQVITDISQKWDKVPIAERMYGVVREPEKMGAESKVIGLWIGVPLAVAYCEPLSQEPGWLKNLDGIRLEAIEAVRAVPPIINDRIGNKPLSVIHGLPILEGPGTFRKLPWIVKSQGDKELRPIFLGVASTVDKTAPTPKGMQPRLSAIFKSTLPAPEYFDGIQTYIGEGNNQVTITCGYFVGLYNEVTGQFAVSREIHADRVRAFENRKSDMLANIAPFLAVNCTPHGYWAVLSDGSTKKVMPPLQA